MPTLTGRDPHPHPLTAPVTATPRSRRRQLTSASRTLRPHRRVEPQISVNGTVTTWRCPRGHPHRMSQSPLQTGQSRL